MQNTTVDMLMYYDGQVHGSYQGLYNPISFKPFKAYYAFKAFSQLYALGNQAEVSDAPEGVSCIAATDGTKKAVMITNKGENLSLKLDTPAEEAFKIYRINDNSDLDFDEEICLDKEIEIEKFETVLLISE